MRNQQKGRKKKEGTLPKRKKEKEGRGFGRLPSIFFPHFLLVFQNPLFYEIFSVQIWSFFVFLEFQQFRILEFSSNLVLNFLTIYALKIAIIKEVYFQSFFT